MNVIQILLRMCSVDMRQPGSLYMKLSLQAGNVRDEINMAALCYYHIMAPFSDDLHNDAEERDGYI